MGTIITDGLGRDSTSSNTEEFAPLTREDRIKKSLISIETQLENANETLSNIVLNEAQEYDFNDGSGRQRVEQIDVEKLEKLISSLEKRRERLYKQLYGGPKICTVAYRK